MMFPSEQAQITAMSLQSECFLQSGGSAKIRSRPRQLISLLLNPIEKYNSDFFSQICDFINSENL